MKRSQTSGTNDTRRQINDNLSQCASLKAEYTACKKKLTELEVSLDREKLLEKGIKRTINELNEELASVEEEIDSDALPEGAQPKARLQKRDYLRMVNCLFHFIVFH